MLARYLPAAAWLRAYSKGDLEGDLIAGVIVTLMLIPQSLAYALLAGLPMQVGLYASILPLVGYAIFGSSRTLAVGPVAVISLMTASAVGGLGLGSPEAKMGAALVLAALSGLILLAMGLARLGFLANLLSHPVISGFIAASALLIAAGQLQHVLGVKISGERFHDIVFTLVRNLPQINLAALVIGSLAIAFLVWVRIGWVSGLQRLGLSARTADLATKLAPVISVIIGTLVAATFGLDASAGLRVVGPIPSGFPPLTLPPLDRDLWASLLPAAVLISVVGFVESVSVAQSLAAKRRQKIVPDQELVGLGAANLASALTGGYPVTGGFARSVVNFAAGAQTPLAGVFTAVLIGAVGLYFTPWFYYLPISVLAATIIVAVLSLVDFRSLVRTWKYNWMDGLAQAVTALTVLEIGIELGIALGVALSLALFIGRTGRPHIAVVGQVPGTEHYRNILRHRVLTKPHLLALRVDESLYFANARYLEDRLLELVAEQPAVKDVLLICSAVNFIDASALESLEALTARLNDAGVRFHLAEVKGPVMDMLQRSHFLNGLTGRIFLSTHEAFGAITP